MEPLIGCVLLAHNQRISAVCGRRGLAPRDKCPMLKRLIASCESAKRTRYCVAGSSLPVCFIATFLQNGSDDRQLSSRIKVVLRNPVSERGSGLHQFQPGYCQGSEIPGTSNVYVFVHLLSIRQHLSVITMSQ